MYGHFEPEKYCNWMIRIKENASMIESSRTTCLETTFKLETGVRASSERVERRAERGVRLLVLLQVGLLRRDHQQCGTHVRWRGRHRRRDSRGRWREHDGRSRQTFWLRRKRHGRPIQRWNKLNIYFTVVAMQRICILHTCTVGSFRLVNQ